jgi:hypothetical protein
LDLRNALKLQLEFLQRAVELMSQFDEFFHLLCGRVPDRAPIPLWSGRSLRPNRAPMSRCAPLSRITPLSRLAPLSRCTSPPWRPRWSRRACRSARGRLPTRSFRLARHRWAAEYSSTSLRGRPRASPERRPRIVPCSLSQRIPHEMRSGRQNRSYKIGTTIMFSAVELKRPNMITIAIGA